MNYDVIVIGAGAAGMMCAAQAGQRGRRVLLIEHYHALGEKIRISGGGRCNFTNVNAGPANYLSRNPDFCRSALARYTPAHFLRMVERHGIAWHEKKLGQLFCDDTAVDIIRMLKDECDRGRVDWRMPCPVGGVARAGDGFVVHAGDTAYRCASVVVATGGLTVPKIGATPFGYRIAEQFGLAVVPPRPALVPLAFAPDALARYGDLSGVSVDAEVACNGGRFRENLLFTHRGLSGPAILQISSYWDGRSPLVVDLLPGTDAHAWLAAHRHVRRAPAERARRTPAETLRASSGAPRTTSRFRSGRFRTSACATSRRASRPGRCCRRARSATTRPKSRWAASTRAGLSSKTMAALAVPGLYFVGEVVDVTGWLGGYNFQWAWASGHAAGQYA